MYSQAVHNGSALSLLPLALPLVNLQNQFEEGAFGSGDVSMPRPTQVLELSNHQVTLLRLKDQMTHIFTGNVIYKQTQLCCFWSQSTNPGEIADPEESTDNITVHRAGHTFHLDRTVTQHALFWPILRTALSRNHCKDQTKCYVIWACLRLDEHLRCFIKL